MSRHFLIFLILWVLLFQSGRVEAHIGSPAVIYEGTAGAYPVRVMIRPPGVVPGLADISVRVNGAQKVTVLPVHHTTGRDGAPPPDVARPVANAPGFYSAELWLMEDGAYSVHVEVTGDRGPGEAIVPVDSIATKRLPLPRFLGLLLSLLGLGLYFGLAGIIAAAVRESRLYPGEAPSRNRIWRARLAGALTLVLGAVLLWGGKSWWDAVDRQYRNNRIYRPMQLEAVSSLEAPPQGRSFELLLNDPEWRRRGDLLPDHDKLLHLFALREPELDAMAHLHPVPLEKNRFRASLPADFPAGNYRLYAEATDETGSSHTLVGVYRVEISSEPEQVAMDPDDSWLLLEREVPKVEPNRNTLFQTPSGARLLLEALPPLSAGRETSLWISVENSAGDPLRIESYLGMTGHAVLRREDGSVFSHLHPVGTISMASQKALIQKTGSTDATASHGHIWNSSNRISFPYEFPQPGNYRFWVQVKSAGVVHTGVFDLKVGPGK